MNSEFAVPVPRAGDMTTRLDGRQVILRPLIPPDYQQLYQMAVAPENLLTWRYRGAPPSPESFGQTLWNAILVQFAIVTRENGRLLGLISAYNPDFRNGLVWWAMLLDPSVRSTGWPMEAAALFLPYLFRTWPFRKIYAESFEFNYDFFASGSRWAFDVEGCLRDYEFHDGQYWHKYFFSISRTKYQQFATRLGFDSISEA